MLSLLSRIWRKIFIDANKIRYVHFNISLLSREYKARRQLYPSGGLVASYLSRLPCLLESSQLSPLSVTPDSAQKWTASIYLSVVNCGRDMKRKYTEEPYGECPTCLQKTQQLRLLGLCYNTIFNPHFSMKFNPG